MSRPCKTVKKLKKVISSSDSEDENLQNLKSAIDPTFNCNGKILDTKKPETQFTSNRNIDDLNKKFSEVNATPEFRNFVAKKLTQRLDSQIKYVDKKLVTNEVPETKHLGVKLLSSSKRFVKIDDDKEFKSEKKKILIKSINDYVDTSSDEEFNERLASVAVSPEWIITGKALYNSIEINNIPSTEDKTETNSNKNERCIKRKKAKKSRET